MLSLPSVPHVPRWALSFKQIGTELPWNCSKEVDCLHFSPKMHRSVRQSVTQCTLGMQGPLLLLLLLEHAVCKS